MRAARAQCGEAAPRKKRDRRAQATLAPGGTRRCSHFLRPARGTRARRRSRPTCAPSSATAAARHAARRRGRAVSRARDSPEGLLELTEDTFRRVLGDGRGGGAAQSLAKSLVGEVAPDRLAECGSVTRRDEQAVHAVV